MTGWAVGKKKVACFFVVAVIFFLAVSCTKSGALTGGTSPSSFNGSFNGSVNGGLSGVANATISVMKAGNPTPLTSANTASDGSFSISFTNPGGNSLLYLVVTGGNAGSGTNAKNQFLALIGSGSALLNLPIKVNELTTAATELAAFNLGILSDVNGSVTLNAPANLAATNNALTQYTNLIASGSLNTSNSNLTSSTQTGLSVMANAFASCIESPSQCSALFNQAQSIAGSVATTLLESGVNALNNSANNASNLYTLAFPFNSRTGFSLSSSSTPSGFSFNNPLAATLNTFSAGSNSTLRSNAIDAFGNIWIGSQGTNLVTEISPSGALLGNFSVSPSNLPLSIAIDASGNIWAGSNSSNLIELNSSGTVIQTISGSNIGGAAGLAIDPAGNLWFSRNSGNPAIISEISPSGTIVGQFNAGRTSLGIAIDAASNVWVANNARGNPTLGSITKFSYNGTTLATTPTGSQPVGMAIDSSGNAWITDGVTAKVIEFSGFNALC